MHQQLIEVLSYAMLLTVGGGVGGAAARVAANRQRGTTWKGKAYTASVCSRQCAGCQLFVGRCTPHTLRTAQTCALLPPSAPHPRLVLQSNHIFTCFDS